MNFEEKIRFAILQLMMYGEVVVEDQSGNLMYIEVYEPKEDYVTYDYYSISIPVFERLIRESKQVCITADYATDGYVISPDTLNALRIKYHQLNE